MLCILNIALLCCCCLLLYNIDQLFLSTLPETIVHLLYAVTFNQANYRRIKRQWSSSATCEVNIWWSVTSTTGRVHADNRQKTPSFFCGLSTLSAKTV